MADENQKTEAPKPSKPAGGVLAFAPQDRMALHHCYMPFFRNGGIFVPTPNKYSMGDDVFVLIKFPDSSAERIPAVGKVVWINRSGTTAKPAGVGIQFSDVPENIPVRNQIESAIAGISQDVPTHTM